MTVYKCRNKRCREHNKEFTAMDIKDAKLATGRGVSCVRCGQVVWYVRPADTTPQVATT